MFQMVRFSKGRAIVIASYLSQPLQIWTIQNSDILSWFKMAFDKIVAICPHVEWLGFRILDPIQNTDILQPNLFSTIWNLD